MRRRIFTSLESRFTFGKYKGLTLADVMDINPDYVVWCVTTIDDFLLYDSALEQMALVYPNFPLYIEFERCRKDNLNEEDAYVDEYEYEEEYLDDYYDWYGCDEERTYNRYNGTYAQDVAGYSDDDIDTIFDGDPDAYWNID